jgi:hypothetical protein
MKITSDKSINFSLSEIAEGGVQEKFAAEMKKVADNILDLNTEAKTKRKVTLELILEPNDNRDAVDVTVNVKSKLAPQVGVATTLLLGRNADTGIIEANELKSGIPGQTYIDKDGQLKTDTGEPIDKVAKDSKVIDLQKNKG